MKKIALIGSTGSIGRQVLSVIKRHGDIFSLVSLSAGNNSDLFLSQVKEFQPKVATIINPIDIDKKEYPDTEFFFGENAFINAITEDADIIVVSLVGFKGIIAVLDAIKKGKNIALANKESLVVGGNIVMKLAKEKGVSIVPIDSEHSAVWQALSFDFSTPFSKIILTASGGAFRDYTKEDLKTATAEKALMHPNWNMGAKITIDCATLVNKAFEVIEAKWFYNAPFSKIDVIIHRESIIHSIVEFPDGASVCQMSYPTMELPIQTALTYPERKNCDLQGVDFAKLGKLTFSPLDNDRFPCFQLVVNAGKQGGTYPAVVNGANEEAVKRFLEGRISYNDIYKCLDNALYTYSGHNADTFEDLCRADEFGRTSVKKLFGD